MGQQNDNCVNKQIQERIKRAARKSEQIEAAADGLERGVVSMRLGRHRKNDQAAQRAAIRKKLRELTRGNN